MPDEPDATAPPEAAQQQPAQAVVIQSQKRLPCGCLINQMSDGQELTSYCVPCGFVEVGNTLLRAGQLFQSMGDRMRAEMRAKAEAMAFARAQAEAAARRPLSR